MRFVVTDEAKADLAGIGRYSRRTWGELAAREYNALIVQAFARLATAPRRGRPQPVVAPGLRRLNVRRHAIFYMTRGDDLVVVRVLHQKMDIKSELFGAKD